MHPLIYMKSVSDQRALRNHRADVMILVMVHHIIGGDESRHISACLLRKVIIYRPIVESGGIATGTAQGFVDGARSAVIGCDSKAPVAICVVEIL